MPENNLGEVKTKKPWQSKTLLLNGIAGLLAAVALFVPQAADVQVFIAAHAAEIGMVWAILGIALRAVTKDKIGLGD